jgi:hypothetical protein
MSVPANIFLRVTAVIIVVIILAAHPRRDDFGEYATTVLS